MRTLATAAASVLAGAHPTAAMAAVAVTAAVLALVAGRLARRSVTR